MARGMMTWPTHVYKKKVRTKAKYRAKRRNRLQRRLERGGKRVMVNAEATNS